MVKLIENTHADTVYILQNMRELDHVEMGATLGPDYLRQLPPMIGLARPYVWTAVSEDGEPIALVGASSMRPGIANVFAMGTDRWGEALLLLTRHILRYIIPDLLKKGFHRAECSALANREDVRRWMGVLGGRSEATLRQWGVNREDFTTYAWLADDYSK